MEILYLLIPIALVILALAIRILFWAVNSGQYDDLETEAQRILFDEDNLPREANPSSQSVKPPTPTSVEGPLTRE